MKRESHCNSLVSCCVLPRRPLLTSAPTNMSSRLAISGVVLASLLFTSCGGSSDTTGPSAQCAVVPPRGTMTAQVNGAAFSANFSTAATISNSTSFGPNIVQVSGVGCVDGTATRTQQLLITIGRLTPITPGTYRLDAAAQQQPAGSGYSGIGQFISAPNLWYANLSDAAGPGSGSVTFTTVTATRLAGTFSIVFVAAGSNAAGNTGRMTATNGAFDISTQ